MLGRVGGVGAFMSSDRATILRLPLPADVTADDDVAAEDGARGHLVVARVRDDARGHWELDGRGVDDAHHVARAGRLEHAEEGPVAAVL